MTIEQKIYRDLLCVGDCVKVIHPFSEDICTVTEIDETKVRLSLDMFRHYVRYEVDIRLIYHSDERNGYCVNRDFAKRILLEERYE